MLTKIRFMLAFLPSQQDWEPWRDGDVTRVVQHGFRLEVDASPKASSDMITNAANIEDTSADMLALGRLVSYAYQQSEAMKLEFPTYCLEIALRAIVQDMAQAGLCFAANENVVALTPTNGNI